MSVAIDPRNPVPAFGCRIHGPRRLTSQVFQAPPCGFVWSKYYVHIDRHFLRSSALFLPQRPQSPSPWSCWPPRQKRRSLLNSPRLPPLPSAIAHPSIFPDPLHSSLHRRRWRRRDATNPDPAAAGAAPAAV
jgi:hypothetical protein